MYRVLVLHTAALKVEKVGRRVALDARETFARSLRC
jgi:hypothetical protein